MPVTSAQNVAAEVVFEGPIDAPIAKGQPLAELVFTPEGLPERRIPLVAETAVERGGFMVRLTTVANLLLTRLANGPEGAM